jgi:hypothetical protein
MGDRIPLGTAAHLLGVSRVAVYYMVRRGELRRTQGAAGWEYFRAEVEALAKRRADLYEQGPSGRPRRRREQASA